MKTKSYAILILAALSLAACKKGSKTGPDGFGPQGKDTQITLNVKQSSGIMTYVPDPDLGSGATPAEIAIKRIDVFIFDGSAPFALSHTVINDQNDIYDGDGLLKQLTVNAKTGSGKKVYVGVNLSPAIVAKIMENYGNLTSGIPVTLSDLVQTVSGDTESIAMFNQNEEAPLDITETGNLPISVSVTRLVAKVAVKKDEHLSLNVPGGSLSDLKFTSGQSNKKLHIAPLLAFKDANWAELSYSATDFSVVNPTDFAGRPVNDYTAFDDGASTLAAKSLYLPENTTNLYRNAEVSYVSVQATFTPTVFSGANTTVAPGETFHAVFADNGIYYYHNLDILEASTYADAHNGKVITYADGKCYYRLYLNSTPASGEGKYDILRNVFYKVNITKINIIGNPHPDQVSGEPGTPTNPNDPGTTPVMDPIAPPSANASILATVSIVPWTVAVTQDLEL